MLVNEFCAIDVIPTFIEITDVLCHDVNILDQLILEPCAFYMMDRAYIDVLRLYRFTKSAAFFVRKGKSNLRLKRVSAAVCGKQLVSDATKPSALLDFTQHNIVQTH
jgi:hypothetical protein